MKKYLLLICVLLCFLLFTGCKQNTDVPDDTTESKTDVQNGTAVVADSSGVLYTIIRPQSADDATIQAAVSVYNVLSELTGSPLTLDNDWTERDESPDSTKYEILVGATNRPESTAVVQTLLYSDWSVSITGNKIVISAQNSSNLPEAAKWFTENLVTENGKTILTGGNVFRASYPAGSFAINGIPVNRFTIVTPKNATENELAFAAMLCEKLALNTGHLLKLTNDGEAASEHEIAVGATSRPITLSLGKCGNMEYRLSAENGSVALLAGGPSAYEKLDGVFASKLTTGIKNGTNEAGEIKAELRLMSSNILFSDDYDTEYRMHCLAETYLELMPDILCLQEATVPLTASIKSLLSDEYTAVPLTATDRPLVYEQILYKSELFTLVESGFTRFRETVVPWGVSYAVLQRISDGKQLCVMCTHLTIISDTYDKGASNTVEGVNYRINDCNTILTKLAQIQSSFPGIPVIVAGDWNGTYGSKSLSPVDASPLVENAQSAAENFADTKTNTAHIVYCTPSLNGGDIIDNIYLTPDSLTVVNLVTVVTGKSVQGSDHCPIYIDFTLK